MDAISKEELQEILESYGLKNLVFDTLRQVEPFIALYFFHDAKAKYCLMVSDNLESDVKVPCDYQFDHYPNEVTSFHTVKVFSYVENAKKKAEGYIDEDHYWTKASTGDICMLFEYK